MTGDDLDCALMEITGPDGSDQTPEACKRLWLAIQAEVTRLEEQG